MSAAKEYLAHRTRVLAAAEAICLVRAPPVQYLAALKDLKEHFDEWIDASIEAAEDDVRRLVK